LKPWVSRATHATFVRGVQTPVQTLKQRRAYDVARYMGTSVRMLDLTYGHLVKGSEAVARERLDAFTNKAKEALADNG
jgi:hypothetical protein